MGDIAAIPGDGRETERKFLLRSMPAIPGGVGASRTEIAQGYPAGCDLRVRAAGGEFTVTVKSDGGLDRLEWEVPVPAWAFDEVWPSTSGRRIGKTRYAFSDGTTGFELDECHGRHSGLVTLEMSSGDVAGGTVPAWAGDAIEVTGVRRWSSRAVASIPFSPYDVEAEFRR